MSNKIADLLKVLDMSEEEQCKYIYDNVEYRVVDVENIVLVKDYGLDLESAGEVKFNNTLADLAFRLRDETQGDGVAFGTALGLVICHCERRPKDEKRNKYIKELKDKLLQNPDFCLGWWAGKAQPIHWIIASLIAKSLAEKEDINEK